MGYILGLYAYYEFEGDKQAAAQNLPSVCKGDAHKFSIYVISLAYL